MPLDILLQTHDPESRLELRDLRPTDGSAAFVCSLFVPVSGYTADIPFHIERECVAEFLDQLQQMNQSLTGTALLQPYCELDQVTFEITRTGAVVVSGELGRPDYNYLRFRFTTDQTCLDPLISDLEGLLERFPVQA